MRFMSRVFIATAVACAAAGCGVTNPSDLKTDSFSGSVSPGGQSDQFRFSPSKTGEVIVKVTSVSPDTGATLLWEYGTPTVVNGVPGCALEGTLAAQQGKTVFDGSLAKTDYCMLMADPGSPPLPRAQSFTFTVSYTP